MAGRSILYLGASDFAAEFCDKLKGLPVCEKFTGSPTLEIPDKAPKRVDLVMFEAGPLIAKSGESLPALIHKFSDWPLVAVTRHDQEHRGIAAMRAGAQGYVCADDVQDAELTAIIEHAIQRYKLLQRLSDRDNTVLSILQSPYRP
jgi:DNA-binding NarL/FixJ family response regulator